MSEKKSPSLIKKILKWSFIIAGIWILIGLVLVALEDPEEKSSVNTDQQSETHNSVERILTPEQEDSLAEVQRLQVLEEREANTLTAIGLKREYSGNEVAADNRLKGKRFYVEGYIGEIGKDFLDNIFVDLKTKNQFEPVKCYISEEQNEIIAQLTKGQKVTIVGTCDGMVVGSVIMKEAFVVKNKEDI